MVEQCNERARERRTKRYLRRVDWGGQMSQLQSEVGDTVNKKYTTADKNVNGNEAV